MIKIRREKKTVVILNTNAGKHAGKASALRAAGAILTAPHLQYTTSSLAELEHVTRTIANDHPDMVVIMGGDSTASTTLTSVLGKLDPSRPSPHILLFAGGTMNTVARSIGMVKSGDRPEDIVHLAQRVRAKLDAGMPLAVFPLSPLRINDSLGFLFGAGTPARFLERYNEASVRGKRRALRVVAEAFMSELVALFTKKAPRSVMETVHASVCFPVGCEDPCAPLMSHTAIMCAAVDQIGLGIRGMPDAWAKPGHFMVRSTDLSFWGIIANSGFFYAGLPMASTFDAVVPEAFITFTRPANIMIDGDVTPGETTYRISSGPVLNFITG